jgi:hypothetical protein
MYISIFTDREYRYHQMKEELLIFPKEANVIFTHLTYFFILATHLYDVLLCLSERFL